MIKSTAFIKKTRLNPVHFAFFYKNHPTEERGQKERQDHNDDLRPFGNHRGQNIARKLSIQIVENMKDHRGRDRSVMLIEERQKNAGKEREYALLHIAVYEREKRCRNTNCRSKSEVISGSSVNKTSENQFLYERSQNADRDRDKEGNRRFHALQKRLIDRVLHRKLFRNGIQRIRHK